jgi:HK97 family phage portal protein
MPTAAELLEQLETEFPNTVQQRVRTYNLKDAYKTVAWVYACCNLIADSISGVEFFFSRPGQTDANGETVQLEKLTEPVIYCFYPPRPGEIPTIAEMIKMQFLHLGLFGETFMYLEKKNGTPYQIDLINPLNITPIVSKDGTSIEKWKIRQVQPDGRTVEKLVPVTDIIQWKYPNPYNKFRGMAPLTAARLAIEQDLNMATWNAGFFQNGLRNPIALMLKQTFNDPQRKEYMNRMRQNFMGFVKGQLPLLVEGGVDVRVLSNTMKDLDFVQGKELTREELCAVYNVPPAMAGIFRYANYSNTKEQRSMLYQNTLRPKMVYYRDVFQQSILDTFFPGVVCDWEWNSIDAFKEDPAVQATTELTFANAAQIYWNMGYTMSQIAYILDKPELDPLNQRSAAPPEPEIPEPEVPKAIRPPRVSQSRDYIEYMPEKRWLNKLAIDTSTDTLRPISQRFSSYVISYLDKIKKGLSKTSVRTVNEDFWIETWMTGLTPIIRQSYIEGVRSAYVDLKLAPPEDILINGDLTLQKKEEQLLELGKSLVRGIRDKVNGELKSKVDGILSDLIPKLIESIPTAVIVHRIYNLGRFETLKKLGVEEVAWCSSGACADGAHKSLHALAVKVGETFPTTDLTFPGETGSNLCSCTLFPLKVKKPEKKVQLTKGLTAGQ